MGRVDYNSCGVVFHYFRYKTLFPVLKTTARGNVRFMKMGTKNRTLPRSKHNKGKKWKKGHSSSSNPENKKFREAAKSRFFNKQTGPSSLTVDALAKHDESQTDKDEVTSDQESDRHTAGGKTFKTWATNWTECTNVTFSRVHRYWSSNSAFHREILAILAAVTEVIKAHGGSETETEYFAALMTALETTDSAESLSAIVYLLSLVIKRVPAAVLRSKFSEVAKQLVDAIAVHAESESTALMKSLLLSLASLLRVQEQAVWSNSSTQRIYTGLLAFTTHKKPKVRKAAHQGVCIVLKGSLFMLQGEHPPHHPAASMTAKYCVQKIEECGGTGEALDTLHTLTLLKDIIGTFPQHAVKSTCETILRLMSLSNVMVTACSMQTLNSLFTSRPELTSLPTQLNAQIIMALYDFQPSENDVQPMQAWLVVMEKAHVNLMRHDEKLCISHLPRLFSAGMTCLLSDKSEVTSAAAKTMKHLLKDCLALAAESVMSLLKTSSSDTSIHKMIKAVDSGLSYQFHSAWGLVLQVFAVFFEVRILSPMGLLFNEAEAEHQTLGKICPELFKKSLLSIANMRNSPRFAYKAELDHAFGCAVKYLGPRHVLHSVPLNITGENDDYSFPRSWMIPLIRDNLYNTELDFFTTYFLPLAAKFGQRAKECSQTNNMALGKSYETLHRQMWSLLPGFCTKPSDLAKSFKGIAKILGTAINEQADLRMEVMSSLRKLITHSVEDDEARKEVSKFAKNFLPILFNLFTTDPEKDKDPTRLAVLETVKCYLRVADTKLVYSVCDKCLEKFGEDDITAFRRQALMDLGNAMVNYVDSTRLRMLLDSCKSNLQNTDRTLQKKCYRILEDICACNTPQTKDFIHANLTEIQDVLLSSLSTSSPSSKAPRLRCLSNIFNNLEKSQPKFVMAVVPEAILCTRELAERARVAAYGLLVEMCNAQIRQSEAAPQEVVRQYFKIVMAGLAGSPQMISATLLALTRILYEFKQLIDSLLLESVVDSVCVLLTSKAREVVKSALAFIKVLLSAYQDSTLAPHLKKLMTSLVSMKEEARHHFRFKAKEIYTKLIKKFGYETIFNMAPASIHKTLINVRKTLEKAKKKKKEKEDGEEEESDVEHFKTLPETLEEMLRDTDSEVEEDNNDKKKSLKSKEGKKKSGKAAWLQETGEDEIMDFLDSSATKRVLATKPMAKVEKKSKEPEFKTAPDGRLIITDDADDEGDGGKISDEDDLDELLEAIERGSGATKRARKRKVEDIGDDKESQVTVSKYKAGGHGIHRPLGGGKKSKPDTSNYGTEYKAKKAGGDVKKKGKPDPFAYVPLQFTSLNKRKQAKMQGRFKNLVKGAQQGAKKGAKKGVKRRK